MRFSRYMGNMTEGCLYRYICERINDICGNKYPPLNEVESGHLVACHIPLTD